MKRQAVILSNKTEYGDTYRRMRFVDKENAKKSTLLRSALLETNGIETCAGESKIFTGQLSPGCRLCIEGKWSCLFINNMCNAHCFYCPSSQSDLSQPSTNTMVFPRPGDYVDYLGEFGFSGVSFSGGEPLLTFDRTLEYLRAVRKHFGEQMYIWLYTNGILLTPEKAGALAAEGLNEIRFDLSANNYRLEKISHAAGRIPVVTVEIPAIPEDLGLLKSRVVGMKSAGIDHLNLHQLRLTPYNFTNLVNRPYTFLHGTKVTVLESELAALELIRYTREEHISLPVNYCSFVYKNRYQSLAARKRYMTFMQEPWEQALPGTGYLRSVHLPGDLRRAPEAVPSSLRESLYSARNTIYLKEPSVLDNLILEEPITLSYAKISLRQSLSYYFPFREKVLKSGMKVYLEKEPVFSQTFANSRILSAFLQGKSGPNSKINHVAGEFEKTPVGLAEYY